jgi:hypothetical protein
MGNTMFDIKAHEFTDKDIELVSADEFCIEMLSRDTSYPVFQREDVIAMAKHFQLSADDLK